MQKVNWKWVWDRLVLPIPFLVFAVLLLRENEWAALGVILSLCNGEGFVGYWMHHGISFAHATGIAVACSTFDITMWFRCLFWIRDAYGHARQIYDQLEPQATLNRLNGDVRWLRHIQRWGLRVYLSCVPQTPEYQKIKTSYVTPVKHYAWLLFYGFTPTCILSGVGYVVAFHLDPYIAFPILAGANAIKMVCFGYWALHTSWKIIVIIVVGVIPAVRRLIERQHVKHTSVKTVRQI